MFKFKKMKKVLISALLLTVMGMSSSVFATGTQTITSGTTTSGTPQQIPTLSSGTGSSSGTTTTTTPTNTNTNTNTTNPIGTLNSTTNTNTNTKNTNTNTNTNSSVYNNTSLPKTGVDYSILLIMLACAVCAIYAYIKIRNYNNIKY